MSSTLNRVSRRASQFFRDRRRGQRYMAINPSVSQSVQDSDDDGNRCVDCLGLTKKRSKKTLKFSIVVSATEGDHPPQLPPLKHLDKTFKKAKSLAVIVKSLAVIASSSCLAHHDIAARAGDAFRVRSSFDAPRIRRLPKAAGAFPASPSETDEQSPEMLIGRLPSPFKIWLTYDKEVNTSSETVIRIPQKEREGSLWMTTTEEDSEPGTSPARYRTHEDKGKGKVSRSDPFPFNVDQRLYNLPPSSTSSSIRELPDQKFLRRQPRLPFQGRCPSPDNESHNNENEIAEQAPLRQNFSSKRDSSRGQFQWGDLSSEFPSQRSNDLAKLRKELHLPSRRVSTPDLLRLQRGDNSNNPFYDFSGIQGPGFSDDRSNAANQANDTFFDAEQGTPAAGPHLPVINNLFVAVQRVENEMSQMKAQIGELEQSEENANVRATFWEERVSDLEELMMECQREREGYLELLLENEVAVPEHLQGRLDEGGLEDDPENGDEDTGYDADVSGQIARESSYDETMAAEQEDGAGDGSRISQLTI